ncbi:SH3 domain-containing protein [Yoonia sp. SDW83-1]|uniref:SH3 domain-containing protein n=1 Tax=Yoonia sp. SDW83-1 TaxID=3366945 RepID=UPI00398C7BB2
MKHWIWIGLVAFFLYTVGQSDPTETGGTSGSSSTITSPRESITSTNVSSYLYVTGSRVNQRIGPGTDHRVMGQLNEAARVRFVSASDGWTQIVSSLGRGWISSTYLSSSRPSVDVPTTRAPVRSIATPTSREIQTARREIIRQSIAAYPGSCPCPYNVDRGGRRCGARSAWSRPGGYSPICYDSDISNARLETYFARQR